VQDLTNAITAALERIATSNTIEKAIEEQLTETIKRTVQDELRSYSDFGKQLNEHVKKALHVDLNNLGMPGYGDFILKIVRRQLEGMVNEQIKTSLEKNLTELLEPPPAEIKLSELVEQFIELSAESRRHSCSCDDTDNITLIVGEPSYGSRWVYLDKEGGTDKYECAIRFLVRDDGGIAALKVDGKDIGNALFVGTLYRFEHMLFQLYAAGTKLILDGDEYSISTNYPGHDD